MSSYDLFRQFTRRLNGDFRIACTSAHQGRHSNDLADLRI